MTQAPPLSAEARELLDRVLAERRESIIDAGADWIIASSEDLRGRRPRAETRALVERSFDIYGDLLSTGDTRRRDEFIDYTTSLRASAEFRISTLLRGFLCFKQGFEIVTRELDLAAQLRLDLNTTLEQLYYDAAFRMADVYAHKLMAALRQTQAQLVEREKLAALGGLVAGVAHEINTPMGVALTAASLVRDRLTTLERAFERGELRKSALSEFLASARPALDMTLTNLERAADLVVSFKQVAVDQSHSSARRIHVASYLREVMASLSPLHRRSGHRIELVLDEDIELVTHPGALSQIVTNLLQNALAHAYAEGQVGVIELGLRRDEGTIELWLRDEGRGLTAQERARIFEPFFTTRRGLGGSGLGMAVVHNLVTELLGGTIALESAPGLGTRISIRWRAA